MPILATCRRSWARRASRREAIALAARTDYRHYHAQAVADLAEVLRLSGRSKESAAVAKEAIRLYEKKGNIVAARALRGFLAELAGF